MNSHMVSFFDCMPYGDGSIVAPIAVTDSLTAPPDESSAHHQQNQEIYPQSVHEVPVQAGSGESGCLRCAPGAGELVNHVSERANPTEQMQPVHRCKHIEKRG